jgi:uncharacterized membrane protein YphA (DoxX/SURF4 family)
VDAFPSGRGTLLATRIGLTGAYVPGGLSKLADFPAAAEQEHFGLYPGWHWANLAILVGLCGSALVISCYLVWLGACGLGALAAIAILVASRFWAVPGHARLLAANGFFEHISLIAQIGESRARPRLAPNP